MLEEKSAKTRNDVKTWPLDQVIDHLLTIGRIAVEDYRRLESMKKNGYRLSNMEEVYLLERLVGQFVINTPAGVGGRHG